MRFRLKACGLHVLSSALLLGLIIGALYLCWYRWPGWFLAGSVKVTLVLAGVDVVLGPLLTLVIASPGKSRTALTRDIGVIVAIQLIALSYGSYSLWRGRPLYYVFSESQLQLVQAYDIDPPERLLAQESNPDFAPHFYSLPRWVYAPLPDNPAERQRFTSGGADIIGEPRYFKSWESGLPALKAQLRKVDAVSYFILMQKTSLKNQMQARNLPVDQPNCIPLTGRGGFMLAVFDSTPKIVAILTPQSSRNR